MDFFEKYKLLFSKDNINKKFEDRKWISSHLILYDSILKYKYNIVNNNNKQIILEFIRKCFDYLYGKNNFSNFKKYLIQLARDIELFYQKKRVKE